MDEAQRIHVYIQEDEDYLKYVNHMLRGAKLLDSLYAGMNESDSLSRKRALKETAIRKVVNAMDTLSLALTKHPSARFNQKLPNNAYFMNFRQYQQSRIFLEKNGERNLKVI
jgi:hypothetical protein